jgi:Na+-transporting methylmalonyl-CoA/oxaloacetate decarboxylase beta subunit
MNPIVMTLIFSVVMMMFMAFPAMKIVEWIASKKKLSQTTQNRLVVVITIILSLIIGIFLQFAG